MKYGIFLSCSDAKIVSAQFDTPAEALQHEREVLEKEIKHWKAQLPKIINREGFGADGLYHGGIVLKLAELLKMHARLQLLIAAYQTL